MPKLSLGCYFLDHVIAQAKDKARSRRGA